MTKGSSALSDGDVLALLRGATPTPTEQGARLSQERGPRKYTGEHCPECDAFDWGHLWTAQANTGRGKLLTMCGMCWDKIGGPKPPTLDPNRPNWRDNLNDGNGAF